MPTTTGRDLFARGEYKRWSTANRDRRKTCDSCGNNPTRLYGYVWWSDDKPEPKQQPKQYFCSLQCFRDYKD